MNILKQISLLVLAACMGLMLAGCQPSDPNSPKVAQLTSIAVTPNPVSLEIGGVASLTVTGSYSDGSTHVVNFDSTFASSAPAIVRVDPNTGYLTALKEGNAIITATTSGKSARTFVAVAPLRVISVAVSPATSTLAVGATQALTVIATYNNTSTGVVTADSTFVVSSNPAAATVDAAGIVTAVAEGTATITATHTPSGQFNSATVTVSAAPSGPFTSITFDEPSVVYTLTGFGGAEDSTLVPDPTDGANTVAKVVKSAAAELWAGTTVSTGPNQSVGTIPFTATSTRMTVRVYSDRVGYPVRLKVEDAANPAHSVETEATKTVANGWQTLTFDFANPAGTGALNLAYTYNKVSIFFDFGTTGAAGGGGTFYFDDVTFTAASGSTGTCVAPNCTDFSAAGIGFGVFENPGGGTAEIATDPNDPTNDVVKFVKKPGDNDYFGTTITGLAGPATLTATNKIVTLRVYSPTAGTNFLLKLEGGPGGAVVERDMVTTVAGTWETLSFDLSTGAEGTYATVVIFPNGRSTVTADKTMYVDELQFPAAAPDSGNTGTCSAPCIDFSSASVGYAPFEGLVSAAQAVDPVDSTNLVAMFVKGPSGQPWAGATIYTVAANQSVPAFDLSTNKIVTLRVYAPAAGQPVLLKLEDAANGAVFVEKSALTTVANQWETLSFDFASPNNGSYDPANTYNRVSVLPAFPAAAPPAANVTYYFDELDYTARGASGGPIVFASGYASNNRTVEGGEWGFYSGNFTNYSNTYAGGGFVDDNPARPAADTYVYLVVATSAPTTDGFMGIFTGAPGYTVAAPNQGVTLNGQTSLKIEIGMAAEWFQQPTNKALTVRLVGAQVYSDGSGGRCQILIDTPLTPTTADLTLYTIALGSMTLAQGCNGGGFGSGVTTLAEALARPIGEVHVQAVFPQVNTTTRAGTEYPTGFTRGSVTFE